MSRLFDLLDQGKTASWSTDYRALAQTALAAAADSSYHEARMEYVALAQVYATFALIQTVGQELRLLPGRLRDG